MSGGNQHTFGWWIRRPGAWAAAAALVAVGLPGVAVVDAEAQTAVSAPAFFLCTARTTDSAVDSYRVPDGITRLAIVAGGGAGAHGPKNGNGWGGRGALVKAVVPVKPGERLEVVAGCDGDRRTGGPGAGEGGNGGRGLHNGGGGGGGSAVVRKTGFLSVDALVVAGGGGGGGAPGEIGGSLIDGGDDSLLDVGDFAGVVGGDGGLGSGANAGNRSANSPLGASGDNGVRDPLGNYYSNGGGGGGGGFRGGRGGGDSSTIFDGAAGGKGGSSTVTPQAEAGSQIVAGGAPRGPGFVVIVPRTNGQPQPTSLAFACRTNPAVYDSFTVPAGATQMFTVLQGGGGGDDSVKAPGGRGAIVQGVLPVAPGEQYRAKAGCRGGRHRQLVSDGGAGYGNGGDGGANDLGTDRAAGGGGGSAVLTLNWRALAIAGGGGGAGDSRPPIPFCPSCERPGGAGGDGSLDGELGCATNPNCFGGSGGARSVVHGGDGEGCSGVLDDPTNAIGYGGGGGGGGGRRGGEGGPDRACDHPLTHAGGGGGGASLQPPEGITTTPQSGPRSDGWVIVVLM